MQPIYPVTARRIPGAALPSNTILACSRICDSIWARYGLNASTLRERYQRLVEGQCASNHRNIHRLQRPALTPVDPIKQTQPDPLAFHLSGAAFEQIAYRLPTGAQKQKRLAAKFIATNPYAYWRRGSQQIARSESTAIDQKSNGDAMLLLDGKPLSTAIKRD